MEAVFDQNTKTGDIVTHFPRASRLLKEYRIDFCCGGNRPIGEAIKEQDLNEEEILARINTLLELIPQLDIQFDKLTHDSQKLFVEVQKLSLIEA